MISTEKKPPLTKKQIKSLEIREEMTRNPELELNYQNVYDNLKTVKIKKVEGEWNTKVKQIPQGEFFLGELNNFVGLPIITDSIKDHDIRREWRDWAGEYYPDFHEKYAQNRLKLGNISLVQGYIIFLIEDGGLSPDDSKKLETIKNEIDRILEFQPGEYENSSYSIESIVEDALKGLIDKQVIEVSDEDYENVIRELTLDPKSLRKDYETEDIIEDVSNVIFELIKQKNPNANEALSKAQILTIIKPKMDGERFYNVSAFTLKDKLKFHQNLDDLIRNFLSGFIE